MGKVTESLNKVMADEAAKAEFEAVIGVRKERELNDGDFQKIVELSEKLGASVTLDEVKDFFSGNGRELSDEELAGVAGGSCMDLEWSFDCPLCGKTLETITFPFFHGEFDDAHSKQWAQFVVKEHLRLHHPDLFGCEDLTEIDENNLEQKAEELIKTKWEKFVRNGKWLSSI